MPCPNSPYVEALSDFGKGLRGRVSKAVITSSSRECGYDMAIGRKAGRRSRPGVHDPPREKHMAFATNDPSIYVDQYSKRCGVETGRQRTCGPGRAPVQRIFGVTAPTCKEHILLYSRVRTRA